MALFVILAGCNMLPQRSEQDVGAEIPDQWVEERTISQPVFEHWVEIFGDPQLSNLVSSALANNYELKAAAARVDAAIAQARIDGASRWPQLSFFVEHEQMQIREAGFGSARFGVFEALFGLSWELDVWGRIRDFQQTAVLEADATAVDYHGARLSLAARVAQSYFELIEAKLLAAVVEQSVKDRNIIVSLVRGRFQRGLVRGLDLRLALTDLANAEVELKEAHNQIQIITRRLEILLGRYPEGKEMDVATLPSLPTDIPAGLPSELLERRPDVVAAYSRLQAADFRTVSSKKLRLPRITLTAAGGTRSTDLTELIDPRAAAWNVITGLMQPLFTGGRIRGEIFRNEAFAEEALNFYKSTALNAFREVEQALAAEEWLRQQEISLRKAVEQTEASQKLAVYSYRNGLIEILTLLDSYRSTLNAQSAHLFITRQLLNNRINIYLALGGKV
ncbi:efflux transporter outer membrane subunit [Nitrosomonas sp. Nm132]|uniref:efflux transporter outer membrane subunit n=1 Tax=Nitrosomonas sp. Nm132 TaxID=1881053 RepID=UPI00088B777F|nr:efflux transporter outer membrane subunit [Nitrosomonas sp. Nm132]SDH13514.1 efflux transporter, outer membrane factor (OMF) lipoprotein, NodT family [Nitrosomonas sp. Nm132]